MIIGSGLIAQGFMQYFAEQDDVCVYAAGVSNSGCTNTKEFDRERLRLQDSMKSMADADVFLYFSTCSIFDPDAYSTAYVQHKLAMEQLVSKHVRHLIFRLPQVAGHTPNPHTLLNYLHARISRSESFTVWKNAKRNIIDIDDVVAVVRAVLADPSNRRMAFNIANPKSYLIMNIVEAMECVVGKKSICVISEQGGEYVIDIHKTVPWFEFTERSFNNQYLYQTIKKYYGEK